MKVLFIGEDQGRAAQQLRTNCSDAWQVTVFERREGIELAIRTEKPDVALVELGRVDMQVLARLQREHPAQAIVGWLATPDSERVADALRAGADDVLDQTMGSNEIAARIEKSLRRSRGLAGKRIELGRLTLDALQGEAAWDGTELNLTARERTVLEVLAEASGRTIAREVIYSRVWGYTMARGDRSVDVNIKRLRDKLTRAGAEIEIKTQAGIGYRLDLPVAAPPPLPVTNL